MKNPKRYTRLFKAYIDKSLPNICLYAINGPECFTEGLTLDVDVLSAKEKMNFYKYMKTHFSKTKYNWSMGLYVYSDDRRNFELTLMDVKDVTYDELFEIANNKAIDLTGEVIKFGVSTMIAVIGEKALHDKAHLIIPTLKHYHALR